MTTTEFYTVCKAVLDSGYDSELSVFVREVMQRMCSQGILWNPDYHRLCAEWYMKHQNKQWESFYM